MFYEMLLHVRISCWPPWLTFMHIVPWRKMLMRPSQDVVHRGITPDNLVVSTENLKERFQLVIADLYSTARSVEDVKMI